MKDDERCSTCKWSQETNDVEKVECHFETPRSAMVPDPRGVQMMSYWPQVLAMHGWCSNYDRGQSVRLSRIVSGKPILDMARRMN